MGKTSRSAILPSSIDLAGFQSLAPKHSRSNARKPLNVDIILKTIQSNQLVNKRLSSPVP